MAMVVNNNKLYIFVADSDAVKNNRIKGSTNSESETTNYCPPESQEQNKMFYDFLGDKDELANKPVYLKVKKLKEYKQKMTTRIKNKYASIFKGDMTDFDSKCDSLIANGDQIIANKLFLTGSRPYLQFDGNENWKTFKEVLYGETSLIILESLEDRFICYPDFHPLFIKPNEVKWEIESDSQDDIDDEELKEEFQSWLTTKNNPDFTGKEKYKNYAYCLGRLIKYGNDNGYYPVGKLGEVDLTNVDDLINDYSTSPDLEQWDSSKNQSKAGIAALQKYKLFLQWKKNGLKECDYIFDNKSGINLIVYGTPGCGKSYYVQHSLLYKGGYRFDDNGINCLDAIRTTFFQDYTNTDFVGQIMPVVNADKSVTYEFNPGPFTLALNKAIQNPDRPIALVIEELNRGNAASIFGDIFQLLDRDNGTSIYNITNVNIQKYLEEQNPKMKFDYIKLPSNLSIFATMNTSDQNVFTLDTAFKRRWKFEKIKNTFLEDHGFKGAFIPGMDMDWEEFCNSINEFIVNDKNFINSEDKQLGVYFVDEKGLRKEQADASTEKARKEFAYKVFEYLWDDVAKYDREKWFNNIKTLDTLIDKYVDDGADDKSGINVFSDGIFKKK